MALDYSRLWDVCAKKGINKTELRHKCGISTATLAKFSKNEPVSLEVIEKICIVLNCNPGDIFTVMRSTNNPLLNLLYKEINSGEINGALMELTVRLTTGCLSLKGVNFSPLQTEAFLKTGLISGENVNVKFKDLELAKKLAEAVKYLSQVAEEELGMEHFTELTGILSIEEFSNPFDIEHVLEKYRSSSGAYEALAYLYKALLGLSSNQQNADILARLIIYKEALNKQIAPIILGADKMLPLTIAIRKYSSDPSLLVKLFEDESKNIENALEKFE